MSSGRPLRITSEVRPGPMTNGSVSASDLPSTISNGQEISPVVSS